MYVMCRTCLTDAWASFRSWQAAESMLRLLLTNSSKLRHAREARAVALPRAVCAALRARRLRKATWLTSATWGFAFFLLSSAVHLQAKPPTANCEQESMLQSAALELKRSQSHQEQENPTAMLQSVL